jgi:hypothetical protein
MPEYFCSLSWMSSALSGASGLGLYGSAERAEKGIQKIVTQLGFVVIGAFEFRETFAEGFDKPVQFFFKRLKRGIVRHCEGILLKSAQKASSP